MRIIVILVVVFLSPLGWSDVPPEQKHEVDYLIRFIISSECRLERNGTLYSGEEAISHIMKKYDYFRDKINTTEDFITYSASKSELTGRSYMAHCGDAEPVKGYGWLIEELKRYRNRTDKNL